MPCITNYLIIKHFYQINGYIFYKYKLNKFTYKKYINFGFFRIFKIQEIIPFPCNDGQFATESDVGGKE